MKKKFWRCLIVAVCVCIVSSNAYSVELMNSGFYWPLIQFDYSNSGTWLGSGNGNAGPHGHIGVDMLAPEGADVYAVADGYVFRNPSKHGWGEGNVAVLVKHSLSDGREFIVLYGHILSSTALKKGDEVYTGKTVIGKLGPYPESSPHLHLGVVPPDTNYGPTFGYTTNSDHNGFVDPIAFLQNNSPYIDFSDDSTVKEIKARIVGNYGWYPPNADCFDAVGWFELFPDKCVSRDRNICYEVQETCPFQAQNE